MLEVPSPCKNMALVVPWLRAKVLVKGMVRDLRVRSYKN